MSSRETVLWSVWNDHLQDWATSTNYSTQGEAMDLLKTICSQCPPSHYRVVARPYGTMPLEQPKPKKGKPNVVNRHRDKLRRRHA